MPTADPTTNKGDPSLAEIGDNSDQERRIYRSAMREQIKLNAERDTLNAKISKARKVFKSNGVVLGKMDSTIRKLAWSPSEQRQDADVEQRYAAWSGLSIGTQIDLMAHAADEDVARADWAARGRADALRLKPASVPKGCPPEHAQDYLFGHEEAKWWGDEGEEG